MAEYVDKICLFGTEAKIRPCNVGEGEPTAETEGCIGALYYDKTNRKIYICVAEGEWSNLSDIVIEKNYIYFTDWAIHPSPDDPVDTLSVYIDGTYYPIEDNKVQIPIGAKSFYCTHTTYVSNVGLCDINSQYADSYQEVPILQGKNYYVCNVNEL